MNDTLEREHQVEIRFTADLTVHPDKKLIPDEWGNDDVRFKALVEDIRERGIDQPLLIDGENRILDGRRRWRAAKRLQLGVVPVIVREAGDVYGVIVSGLVQRGHYTQSQLAYLTYPLMARVFDESRRRRLQNLRHFQGSLDSAGAALSRKSVEDEAQHIGISRRIFFDAQKVHLEFGKHNKKRDLTDQDGNTVHGVTFKEFYEPLILREEKPYGLGAVIAGIAGSLSTSGKAKRNPAQLELFSDAFDTLTKRFDYWHKFDADEKATLKPVICGAIAAMPQDLCDEIESALRARKKQQHKREE